MLPLQIAEMVGWRIPVCSDNSFCVISFSARITFNLNFNGIRNHLLSFHYIAFYFKIQYAKRKKIT